MIKTDIKICGGGYTALLRSDLGGCCYSLKNDELGGEILNTPNTEEELRSNISIYGNPILFPPNRIRGGRFDFRGKEYSFPVNEPRTGAHLHGMLRELPFSVSELRPDTVTLSFRAEAGEYLGFPHAFEAVRDYTLGSDGLTEKTTFRNLSDEPMPFMLAFHTTFQLRGLSREARLLLPVVREQQRDEYFLPTLLWSRGRERDREICKGEYKIYSSPISALYEIDGSIGKIVDPVSGISIVCECSEHYGYRMLWRSDGADFLCIEPQTCAIDCFHLDTPPEENGLIVIEPGESVTLKVRYAAERI